MERRLPKILKEHSNNVKQERADEDKKMAETIQKTIIEVLDEKVEELKEISLD